jgi:catechol 2,3-dioxygenase-like lactoylglutathione lyase family enzyme
MLVAYNTEAQSSNHQATAAAIDEYPLTITIPTPRPQETIEFYRKLGFRHSQGMPKGLDVVCMEKDGTSYKLEICHNKFSEAGPVSGGVSGMTFPVPSLQSSIQELQSKGLSFVNTRGIRQGVAYASLEDPNGISINLFEKRSDLY